jgi:hypothetical protein
MSLLHDDLPPAAAVGRCGLNVRYLEDGALGILDTTTNQAMHLSPAKAEYLIRYIRMLDRPERPPSVAAAATKPTNPKDAIGSDKLPLHLWPSTATALGCLGLLDGALKYGRSNFRAIGVRASIYYDAARRHLDAWFEGENTDPDSGLPHHAHALACLAILVDAEAVGKLTDDRMVAGRAYRPFVGSLTPHVARLKQLHAAKSPRHYTIADKGAA